MMARQLRDVSADERPLGELVSDMTGKLQDLLRKEMELAKLETKEQVTRAGKAGAMFGAAGATAFVALLLVSFAAAWGLAEAIPVGLAFLAVGLLYAVVAGVLATQGRNKLASFKPVPEQTIKTLRDDVEVARESLSRGATGPTPRPMTTRSWNA